MVFSIISKGLLLTLVLMAIKNYDRIVERRSAVPMISVTEERFVRTEWLAGNLKSNYVSRCQICGHSFQVVYGVGVAESHHIHHLHQGSGDVSTDMAVICPNHHCVIHATDARFNKATLTYEYPNGLRELLLLPDHFREEVISKP